MYLRKLRIQNVKRLRDFTLDFTNPDGTPRMWTVLIGENGTAKTTILQCIAMLAAGEKGANQLATPIIRHLHTRRSEGQPEGQKAELQAMFDLPAEAPFRIGAEDPIWHTSSGSRGIVSELDLRPGSGDLDGRAFATLNGEPTPLSRGIDVLSEARAFDDPYWFVAAYGVSRHLPEPSYLPPLSRPSIERLGTLFGSRASLTSTSFSTWFSEQQPDQTMERLTQFGYGDAVPAREVKRRGKDKALRYHRVLKRALLNVESLLPDIQDIELRGKGGVVRAGDLMERDKFRQQMGRGSSQVLPLSSLSHGYQSTIAWIADLVGHVLLEADYEVEPKDMVGLVLIDEIDAYLHPLWQVELIPALKKTFPKMQFVVSTHSPLVLAGLRPDEDEVIRLKVDEDTGEVVRLDMYKGAEHEPDARVMTTARIFQEYFGLKRVYGGPEGVMLAQWQSLATNPFRTDSEQKEMKAMAKTLKARGVELGLDPTPRRRG